MSPKRSSLDQKINAHHSGFITQWQLMTLAAFSGHCVSCQFDITQYSDELFVHLNILLPASLERAMNKRKAEFLAGRFCAQQALNRLGLSPLPIPIGQHRAPMWPAGVCGAITHHQDPQQATALCAVSRDAIGVGIDLESTLDAAQAATLAPNIINQTEQALIMRLGLSDAFATWLTFIFSAKETLFKALHPLVGFYFDFLDVELSRINLHQQYMVLSLKQDLTATLTRGRHFVVHYQRVNSQVLTHMEHFANPESAIQFRLKSLGS